MINKGKIGEVGEMGEMGRKPISPTYTTYTISPLVGAGGGKKSLKEIMKYEF